MHPPPGLRLRQRHAPMLEVDMLPANRAHFRYSQSSQRRNPDRGDARGVPVVEPVKTVRQRCQLVGIEHTVSRLLPRPLDTTRRIRVLRSPFPRLKEIEEPRDKRQYTVTCRVRQPSDCTLHVSPRHGVDATLAEGRSDVELRLIPIGLERPPREPTELDPLRGVFVKETIQPLVDGRRLALLAATLQRIRFARADYHQFPTGPLANVPQRQLGASRQCRPAPPACDPVVEEVALHAGGRNPKAEPAHLRIPYGVGRRPWPRLTDDTFGQRARHHSTHARLLQADEPLYLAPQLLGNRIRPESLPHRPGTGVTTVSPPRQHDTTRGGNPAHRWMAVSYYSIGF